MVAAVLLAVQTVAHASLNITWNTRQAAATQAHAASQAPVLFGTLVAVKGNAASLRLADGTVRTFVASPEEIPALRARIGTRIAYRVTP